MGANCGPLAPNVGPPGSTGGPNLGPSAQIWGPGSNLSKLCAEKLCRMQWSILQTEPYVASYGRNRFGIPHGNSPWGLPMNPHGEPPWGFPMGNPHGDCPWEIPVGSLTSTSIISGVGVPAVFVLSSNNEGNKTCSGSLTSKVQLPVWASTQVVFVVRDDANNKYLGSLTSKSPISGCGRPRRAFVSSQNETSNKVHMGSLTSKSPVGTPTELFVFRP